MFNFAPISDSQQGTWLLTEVYIANVTSNKPSEVLELTSSKCSALPNGAEHHQHMKYTEYYLGLVYTTFAYKLKSLD